MKNRLDAYSSSSFSFNITIKYLVALGLIAALSFAGFLGLYHFIKITKTYYAVINDSGRQRMLSQRIALLSRHIIHEKGAGGQKKMRQQLLEAATHMEKIQSQLTRNVVSQAARAIYFSAPAFLDSHVRRYVEAAKALADEPANKLVSGNPHKDMIETESYKLLQLLDNLVDIYQKESEESVQYTLPLAGFTLVIIMLVLLVEGLFIFRPTINRLQTEALQLLESKKALSEAQRISRAGSWGWNIANNDFYWSDEAFLLYGRKPGEIEPTLDIFLESIHADDRDMVLKAMREALARNEPFDIEHRVYGPDSVNRIVRAQGEVTLRDETGKPVRMVGSVHDITERARAEKALQERNKYIKLLQEIAVKANEAQDTEEVLRFCVKKICDLTEWPIGHVYAFSGDSRDELIPMNIWHTKDEKQFNIFHAITMKTSFNRGAGLPGRVLLSGKPAWIVDVTKDPNFPRAKLAKNIGVKAGVAFPVLAGESVEAVLEFFSPESFEPDEDMLGVLQQVGIQIGRIIERKHAAEALSKSKEALEERVKEATGELMAANEHLRIEIAERKRSDEFLRESEERLTRILETITEGIYFVNQEGRITFVNAAAEKIFGISRKELFKMTYSDFKWKVTKPNGKPLGENDLPFAIIKKSGKPVHGLEFTYERLDGNRVIVSINAAPLRDSSGAFLGMVAVQSDITEKKALENQLYQAQKLESIGQLAAGVAHEINTPIQYVGDNTKFLQTAFEDIVVLLEKHGQLMAALKSGVATDEIIKDVEIAAKERDMEYLLEEAPKAIKQSLTGVDRVADIVRAMKEFSHPGAKEKTPTDINKAIENTITVTKNEWKYVAEMKTDFDNTLPLTPCLPGDFNQVILNLITNAAYAISEAVDRDGAKGVIEIKTRRNGNNVEIRVSDTGAGVPENVRHKIFDPFFTTKDVGKGTGQGLAISRSVIADKHGGSITFETEDGKGTTFIVRLPL